MENNKFKSIEIKSPVLLLIGPLGYFFSRLSNYLIKNGVEVYKVQFPLVEFGHKKNRTIKYSGSVEDFENFLRGIIESKGIKQIFMYGDYIKQHKIAINLAKIYKIEPWVFELGYIRPNYVTLEKYGVNNRSPMVNVNLEDFQLNNEGMFTEGSLNTGPRFWKYWKIPTFILHSFKDYDIIDGPHKLQPSVIDLLFQVRGLGRKYKYKLTELITKYKLKKISYFLIPLQVATDTQITNDSDYNSVEEFISEIIESFSKNGYGEDSIVFKHHPKDRGYNNYGKIIRNQSVKCGISSKVHYIHDSSLAKLITRSKGLVMINSTVGIQGMFHNRPVKALGRCFYNRYGLTDQKPLDEFWKNPEGPKRKLFIQFYNYVMRFSQINGNYDGIFPFEETFMVRGKNDTSVEKTKSHTRQYKRD